MVIRGGKKQVKDNPCQIFNLNGSKSPFYRKLCRYFAVRLVTSWLLLKFSQKEMPNASAVTHLAYPPPRKDPLFFWRECLIINKAIIKKPSIFHLGLKWWRWCLSSPFIESLIFINELDISDGSAVAFSSLIFALV